VRSRTAACTSSRRGGGIGPLRPPSWRYDAVAANESAVELQGETVLATIARKLVAIMRRDIKTDWTVRDDVKAKLRSSIKRLLVKYDSRPTGSQQPSSSSWNRWRR
jgi:type I restriction enzyme R subunit